MNRDNTIEKIKGTNFKIAFISANFLLSKPEDGIHIRVKTQMATAKNKIIEFPGRKLKYDEFMVSTDGLMNPMWNRTGFYCHIDDVDQGIQFVKDQIQRQADRQLKLLKKEIDSIGKLDLSNNIVKIIDEDE